MRFPIPSTFLAALSVMGKASEKEIQVGVKLARIGAEVFLSVDGSEILAFSMNEDTGAQSLQLALGKNPSSRMLGIAKVAMSATGAWIRKTSDAAIERQREVVLGLLDKATNPEEIAMVQRMASNLSAGLVFYAPSQGAKPLADGIIVPILA